MVDAVEVEFQGLGGFLVVFSFCELASLDHLGEHHVAALAATFGLTHGVEVGGVFAHAHEGGTFAEAEVFRSLAEVDVGGCFNAHGIVEEIEIVEIEREYFLLGIMSFKFHGDDPLDGFLHESLHGGLGLFGVELLGELLGDGTAAACLLVAEHAALHHGTHKGAGVDAGVLKETDILGGHEGIEELRGNAVVADEHAVFVARPGAHEAAVGTDDL